ncbi:hypothetical protein PYCC9005_005256 [Savitreella phatthalungensis]
MSLKCAAISSGKSARALAVDLRRHRLPGNNHTIYLSPGKLDLASLVWGLAGVNLLFWGNLASWTYERYSIQVTEDQTKVRYEKAPQQTRAIYSALLAGIGLCITTAFMAVSRR